MELNSSCRERLYQDACIIESKVVLYLVGIMLLVPRCTTDCTVISHDWLSLASGVIPLVYLPFRVLTHPLSLRGAGALVNIVGELLPFCELSSLVWSLFATSVSVLLVLVSFAAKGRLLTL